MTEGLTRNSSCPWWVQKRVLLSVGAAFGLIGGGLMLLRHWAGW